MSTFKWDKVGLFVGGMVFATKGVQALGSKVAHKVYVHTTAAALRGRDEVMGGITAIREGCEDIYAEAVELNEKKAEEAAIEAEVSVIEDESEEAEPEKKTRKSRKAKKED